MTVWLLSIVSGKNNWDRSWLWYGDVGLIFGSLTSISPGDRGQKILGVSLLSLLPPAWPNISGVASSSQNHHSHHRNQPPLLGGNSKKTHNGIYLLCLAGPRVKPGDYKSSIPGTTMVLNLVITGSQAPSQPTNPTISHHLGPLLSACSISTRFDRYL